MNAALFTCHSNLDFLYRVRFNWTKHHQIAAPFQTEKIKKIVINLDC